MPSGGRESGVCIVVLLRTCEGLHVVCVLRCGVCGTRAVCVCLLWGGVPLHFAPLETQPLSRFPSFPLRVITAASFHLCSSRTPPLPPPVFTSKLFELKRQGGDVVVGRKAFFPPQQPSPPPHCGTGVCVSAHLQEFICIHVDRPECGRTTR
ncbi:unnamed protein product [Trypanosoma congolense IL3000]|uniref:WGS project CAEQ00000000 data, annotated contig 1373 n=1 Tax=Trypanosoma congolense (strain IL3000) TaxID=1068625 RepID=F9W5T3_TRYCI|nr:unnamed protein product [Trypanosoma congolense IL3000]